MATEDPALGEVPLDKSGPALPWLRVWEPRGWLGGVLLGVLVCPLLLLGVLPRQELATAPREPEAELGFPSALSPQGTAALAAAKLLLGKGKAESGLTELAKALESDPGCQEARWLMATTYDRLGDRARAARAYRAYLAVEHAQSHWREQREAKANAHLSQLEALP